MALEERDALDYGLRMFTYHAGQRMEVVKLFFVSEGAALAAFVGLLEAGLAAAAAAVAGFNLLLVFAFANLDRRNGQLAAAAEGALAAMEAKLAAAVGEEAVEIVRVGDRGKKGFARYSRLMPLIFWLAALGSLIALGTALVGSTSLVINVER